MGIIPFLLVGLVERLVVPWHHETRARLAAMNPVTLVRGPAPADHGTAGDLQDGAVAFAGGEVLAGIRLGRDPRRRWHNSMGRYVRDEYCYVSNAG